MEKNLRLNLPCPLTPLTTVSAYRLVLVLILLSLVFCAQAQPTFLKALASGSTNFISAGGKLYYSSADSLYVSDGTAAGTMLVKKTGEVINTISKVTLGNTFFFITSVGGQKSLWRSHGTSASTIKVGTPKNIITPLVTFNGALYLMIDDGVTGNELWKLDAADNLSLVKDVNVGPGNGFNGDIVVSNNTLYFHGQETGKPADLWKSNGTTAGTVLAVDLEVGDVGYMNDVFYNLTDVNGTVFFARTFSDPTSTYNNISQLWKTSGTPETTEIVKDFDPDNYGSIMFLTPLNGKLYFIINLDAPFHFLVESDGTYAGTKFVKQVGIDGEIVKMVAVNNYLVLYDQSQSFAGWIQRSDGTEAGTVNIHKLSTYSEVSAGNDRVGLVDAGSRTFFADDILAPNSNFPGNSDDYNQLWQSDLTEENTKPLKEIFNISFHNTKNIVAVGESIFFTTNENNGPLKLWFYDPNAVPTMCPGAGSIVREVWTNVSGNSVAHIPLNSAPDSISTRTLFEAPSNVGDKYGARMRAYLCVPVTGYYNFYISSNDNSDLYLSTTAYPANKQKIAYVNGATNPRQWNKFPSQTSANIYLQAGQRYYIEALHKEGVGSDHLAVGMKLPDGTFERPIPGIRLIPYDSSENKSPIVNITSPVAGQEFLAPANITITASASDPDGTVTKVEFYNYSSKIGEDTTSPFSISWTNVTMGDYNIHAVATDSGGLKTSSADVTFKVIEGCSAAGYITREAWNGVSGNTVSAIPVNTTPSATQVLFLFEAPSNVGINYGARIRGYICPPTSGTYVFYIASNDNSELLLSTDDNPANKVKIASVTGATGIRQWDKYPSQRSGTISLVQGKRYYIEALHKQGVGSDNLAVGWLLPNGGEERPIDGSHLAPFGNIALAQNIGEPEVVMEDEAATVEVFPNPAARGPVTVTLSGIENKEVMIEIISMKGAKMLSTPVHCKDDCGTIQLNISDDFAPGVYLINGTADRTRFTKKLLIRE